MALRPSEYYAEPLASYQLRGAQLGKLRQDAEMERAKIDAEMQAYGATSPRELMFKKAMMTREQAEMDSARKRLEDFSNVMQDWEEMDPPARKAMLEDEEIRGFVGQFVKPESLKMEKEGTRFQATTKFPGMIMTADGKVVEGATRPGQEYVSVTTPDGGYFKEVVGTEKVSGKKEGAAGEGLSWDKAARDTVLKLVGTTTASGIVIDEDRQQETAIALSLLKDHKKEDVNTAATNAISRAQAIMRQIPEGKEIAQIGVNKKTGKRVAKLTDGTIMPLE